MKNLLILTFILLTFGVSKAQKTINYYQYIPEGYQLKDVNGELGSELINDFDNDGIKDLAIILFEKIENYPIFCIYLSSKFNNSKSYKYCDWTFMVHTLSYENDTLSLYSHNGGMGIYGSMELKYDDVKRDLEIINYEDSAGGETIKFNVMNVM